MPWVSLTRGRSRGAGPSRRRRSPRVRAGACPRSPARLEATTTAASLGVHEGDGRVEKGQVDVIHVEVDHHVALGGQKPGAGPPVVGAGARRTRPRGRREPAGRPPRPCRRSSRSRRRAPRSAFPGPQPGDHPLDRRLQVILFVVGRHDDEITEGKCYWVSFGRWPGRRAVRLSRLDRALRADNSLCLMTGNDPLRIALLVYRGNPHSGGQGVYTRYLSRELVDLGHQVTVFAGQPWPVLDDGVGLRAGAQPRPVPGAGPVPGARCRGSSAPGSTSPSSA